MFLAVLIVPFGYSVLSSSYEAQSRWFKSHIHYWRKKQHSTVCKVHNLILARMRNDEISRGLTSETVV